MRNLKRNHLVHLVSCKQMSTAIRRAKKHLIQLAKSEGLYENFGELEVGHIQSHFINISDYSDEMNARRSELTGFRRWLDSVNVKTLSES